MHEKVGEENGKKTEVKKTKGKRREGKDKGGRRERERRKRKEKEKERETGKRRAGGIQEGERQPLSYRRGDGGLFSVTSLPLPSHPCPRFQVPVSDSTGDKTPSRCCPVLLSWNLEPVANLQ